MDNQTAKADNGKIKLSLVPTNIVRAIGQVREYGNGKYGSPDNWKQVDAQRYIDAYLRHTIAFIDDVESIDPESGLPHLWHCACNLAFLVEKLYPHIPIDERVDYRVPVPKMFGTKTAKSGDCQWHSEL